MLFGSISDLILETFRSEAMVNKIWGTPQSAEKGLNWPVSASKLTCLDQHRNGLLDLECI
jgi:hypothetical protein